MIFPGVLNYCFFYFNLFFLKQYKNSELDTSESTSFETLEMFNPDSESSDIEIFDLNSKPIVMQEIQVEPKPHRQPRPTFYNQNNNHNFYNNYRPPFQTNYPQALQPFPVQIPQEFPNNNQNRPFQSATPVQEFPIINQNRPFQSANPISNTEFDASSESELYDLTNDIRVNQILAEQGRPFHPDAEFISVPNQPRPRPFESYPQQYPPYYFTAFRGIKK